MRKTKENSERPTPNVQSRIGEGSTLAFLLFLSKAISKVVVPLSRTQSALGRSQTRLLTAAQARGWIPGSEEELNRLSQRQFKLWIYDANRRMAKRMASGEPLFETVPKEDEPKTLTGKGN